MQHALCKVVREGRADFLKEMARSEICTITNVVAWRLSVLLLNWNNYLLELRWFHEKEFIQRNTDLLTKSILQRPDGAALGEYGGRSGMH